MAGNKITIGPALPDLVWLPRAHAWCKGTYQGPYIGKDTAVIVGDVLPYMLEERRVSKAKTTTALLKMVFFLKSLSRSVHDQEHHHEPVAEDEVETRINDGTCTTLTVWRKSLLISCNGFTNLVYRVDNYIDRPDELVLMDGSGKSILTMRRRKKLGVPVHHWIVYEGEVGNYCETNKLSKKPIWCVRKNN
ncbi:protein LURP-one-related 17 [Populus alba x Populus x berolinensis]|nr:protein LURP-one-related 17 [Populus alba x Populus x berolinensis]